MNSPRLHIVTGKGGVGKSTFAAALSLVHARRGERVLALEFGAPGGLAGLFGVTPPAPGVLSVAAEGVTLAFYEGQAALAEYVSRFLPLGWLLDALFRHRLYRAFVDAGPGVRELLAIGKVRDELLGLATGSPRFDRIVLDLGSSGHALQTLRMPRSVTEAFAHGLAHQEAARVHATLADPGTTAIHVLALPEEMPVREAGEVIEQLRGALALPLGRLVVNRCRPIAPASARAALALLSEAELEPGLIREGARELAWANHQEQTIAALEQRVGMAAFRLPRLTSAGVGLPEVKLLADCVERWA